jgi:hypothetical protein
MIRSGLLVCVSALATALAGCNHSASTNADSASSAYAPVGLTKPAATADVSTWGAYLSQQGKLHGKDADMRPYIYVIPGGDTPAANNRRQDEASSIVHSVRPILASGGTLILGGPDPAQTTAFITDLSKQLKTDGLKGILVMVVSDASEQAANTSALKANGATVRFITM